jgi:hypothetical protein
MGQNPRRPGFRLRWGDAERTDEAAAVEAAGEQDAPAAETTSAEATATDAPAEQPADQPAEQPEGGAQASAPQAAAPAHVTPVTQADAADVPFLRDLVGAMRGVAESSRDSSLETVRHAVEERVAELTATAAEKAEELRRSAEHDVNGIGDWERTELERVRGEAEQRREARRAELEKQLADHQSATDGEVEATRNRLADHERELDAFFAQLSEITDPAAFVAAAKRMPPPPDLTTKTTTEMPAKGAAAEPASAAATEAKSETNGSAAATPPSDESLARRLAQLNQRLAQNAPAESGAPPPEAPAPETSATPEPAPAAAPTTPAPTASAAGAATAVETSTAIVVKGLGSFGAITSFKQALERVDGVRGVTLSLGPTGDFVYRASHAADFDILGAIRSIEGPNTGIEQSDGSLVVTIAGPR